MLPTFTTQFLNVVKARGFFGASFGVFLAFRAFKGAVAGPRTVCA
jgi:hypothetical protein